MEHIYDVAVIGGGIAGYSAALSSKSLGLDCLWLGETMFGEKLKKCAYVRNYPAFSGDGARFFETLARQCGEEGVLFTQGRADGVYRTKDGFTVTAAPESYASRAVILCTGVDLAGSVEGEKAFLGRGVSYCAVCDGALYRGKTIAAVLSSPEFCGEADYLAGFAEKVYVFGTNGVRFSGENFSKENIEVREGKVRAVAGDTHVGRILTEREELAVSGVFFLKNAVPPDALAGGVGMDGAHIAVQRDLSTNLKGLFAAGDVTGRPYQFAKAAGEGLVAAHSAKNYLSNLLSSRASGR